METSINIVTQELIFSSGKEKNNKQITKFLKEKKIKKIANRVYTNNFIDPVKDIITRNIFNIIGNLYPGSLLSHRSALEFKPTKNGYLFVTYSYTKKIKIGPFKICFIKGNKPIVGDNSFFGNLHVSQLERAFLENVEITKKSGDNAKTISQINLEERLEKLIQVHGESYLNKLRDKAKIISKKLHKEKEFKKLNLIIGALLNTKPAKIISSPSAMARMFGNPFDISRLTLFEKLFVYLQNESFKEIENKNSKPTNFKNMAFFESYFSNYIEGTEFEIEEAHRIIETQKPIAIRHEDSHDILGTYQIVSNKLEMSKTPQSIEDFIAILQYRHKVIMQARTNKNPGVFKDINNRAGDTNFVDYKLVRGTLLKGFEMYRAIRSPFSRAIFMMFIISEIHPFLDGNGRIARIMMNAELVKAGLGRIIIPTVYREDYLIGLRRLTRKDDVKTYTNMMYKIYLFSANIAIKGIPEGIQFFKDRNCLKEPEQGKLIWNK